MAAVCAARGREQSPLHNTNHANQHVSVLPVELSSSSHRLGTLSGNVQALANPQNIFS
jgi:hypothetical protein